MTDSINLEAVLSRRREILKQIRNLLYSSETKATAYAKLGIIIGKKGPVFFNAETGSGRVLEEDVAKIRAELEKSEAGLADISLLKPVYRELLDEREDKLDLRCLSVNLRPLMKARGLGASSRNSDAPQEPSEVGDPDTRPTMLAVSFGDSARFTIPRGGVLIISLTKDGKIVSQLS